MVSEFSREVGGQQGDEARTNLDDVRNADPARTDRGSRPRRRPARRRGPRAVLLPQLLAAAVERDPAATAVVFGDRSLTYAELDAASSRTARLLINRGVGPEDVVAVSLARSIESVLAVWSVAKSGAAFVPVDPNYPADRIEFMIDDSGARLGLTRSASVAALPETVEWIALDDPQTITDADALPSAPVSFDERVLPLRAENPAYVIYTSGSTGRPKGVPVTHTGLDDLAQEVAARFDLTPQSRVLHVASPSFDASVFEWLMTISVGATMVVAPPTVFGGDELAELLRRERVTHAVITPAVLTSIDPSTLTDLEMVLSAGEACPPDVVERWAPGRRFFNGYGPTESTIMTHCSGPLEPGRPVTIGTPVRNLSASVLDARLNPVAPGVAGELYVSGTALARGYRGRPGLTAERFVAGPGGTRLYRTGDLVRTSRGTNGELIYLGRNDFQVKIRGFRVELGEIDAALAACDGVDFAMTVGRETPAGQAQLVSYLHSSEGVGIDTRVVTEEISNVLPSHMVPSVIVVLDEIPLTPSGKVDRAALPDPDPVTVEFRPPVTDTEIAVAEEFATLLGLERVGLDDDFFDLGGNSLVATRVAARLGERLDTRVPARLLFEGSTVAALAALIEPLGTGGRIPLTAGTRPETIPLSLAQQRMWFLSRFDTGSAANNIPVALRLRGALDVDALRAAIADLVDRHETLRTVYPDRDGVGSQVILPPSAATPTVRVEDVPVSEVENRVLRTVSAGFDVTTEVPLRLELLRVAPDEYVLVIVVHHIAADGASTEPFVRDLVTAYLARTAGAVPGWQPLAVQYADYTLWQRAVLGSEDDPDSPVAKEIAYWTSVLADLPDRLELPTDRPRPVEASGRGATVDFEIDPALHAAVAELGRAAGCSPFMVVHAAFAVLLSRISGARDIAIGTPVAGRGEQALDDLIGMFVNTLVLRTDITPDLTCAALLHRVRDTDIDAFAHADLPFERLVEILDPVRSAGHHPLFQVALFFQNMAQPELALHDLELVPVDLGGSIAKFDLQLTVTPREVDGHPAGIGAQFTYATDLFDDSTVRALADRLVSVLGAFASDADIPVGEIDLLTPHERHAFTVGVNATDHPTDTGTLLSRYRAQVDRVPGATAVLFGDESLTYAEFDARVNRLARHLISSGVGPESLVALGIRRSIDLVVAMYAVVTAGGAYVPLDPDHPADRIGHILDTARPVCVLSTSADAGDLPEGIAPILLDTLEADGYDAHPVREDELRGTVQPASPAYVIFTSGSTGRPKGVSVPHEAIVNQLEWMAAEYDIAGSDVYLQKTATTFDVSLWGYFLPLRTGGTLVVAPHDAHRDPAWVADAVTRHRVTLTDFVPSMLTVFAAQAPAGSCASLRHVFVIGEALPPETVSAFRRLGDAALHNLYGPTEAAVSATYWPADGDGHSVPIGVPEWNVQVYVLDSRLAPTPVGTPGELYLGGVQLARGYEKRPDLSSDRFVASPLGRPGSRMYRTGDLVRWRRTAAGELVLDYLGRTDFQVKFRGQRIELGEIETALLGCAEVSQAVALVVPTSTGEQLVAYVVPAPGHTVDRAALLDAVKKTSPSYMVPSAVVALDEFPLNTSGKLDRKALPAPVFEAREFRAARTPIEEIVAGVYADVLGVARVGADDDFFELGGNSLVATQVAARLGAALGARVAVRSLFEHPIVESLAAHIESSAAGAAAVPLTARPRPDHVPLSLAQQRMWFLNRFEPDSAVNNLPLVIRLRGSLDLHALRGAVGDVVLRHESLRTVYPETDGIAHQVVLPAASVVPDIEPSEVDPTDILDEVAAILDAGFDVTTEVPLRIRLLRVAADDHVLVVVLHHISGDGFSMGPLARDVVVAYGARTEGLQPNWSPLPVQYADYTLWQREVLGSEDDPESPIARQLAYWRHALKGIPEQIDLPADRPRPAVASGRGANTAVEIDAWTHAALDRLARERGASLFMVFHSALAALLSRLSGTEDVVIGAPIAGRGEQLLDDMIGMFVNTLVLRSEVRPADTFADLLGRVRESDLGAFGHADLPFERLVEVLDPERSQARHPLFQVALTFQNLGQSRFELPGLAVEGFDVPVAHAKFDLQVTVVERFDADGTPGGFDVVLTYAVDLFDEATMRLFGDRLGRMLAAVATDPESVIGDVPLLDPAERTEVLEAWNEPGTRVPDVTLVDRFREAAEAHPDSVAVTFGDRQLTYAELSARVNRLARELVDRGVRPDTLVGVALPRTEELVVALLAVQQAGGGYLPIDLTYPAERLTFMLEDAAPVCVLVAGEPDALPATDVPVIDLERLDLSTRSADPLSDDERAAPLRSDNLAYVIYTSGSTGRPKGVQIPHRTVLELFENTAPAFGFDADDVWTLFHSYAFDFSVWELWGPLLHGGRLVVVDYHTSRSPEDFHALLRREKITVLNQTPSAFYQLAEADAVVAEQDPDAQPLSLRYVVFGGEALDLRRLAGWYRRHGDSGRAPRLVNMYGITETTVHVSHLELSSADVDNPASTVGRAIPGLGIYVLDARLQPVPVGVPGEIYVRGGQLARGYLGRAELTSGRFVADPYGAPGSRMYRTGDVARWNAHGQLEYAGRSDLQVQLRGFRIELGEIEAALTGVEGVAHAVASVWSDEHMGEKLVGYVVPRAGHTVAPSEVLERVGEFLTGYMVPDAVLVLDELPLTPNGKLDRRSLPAPVFTSDREFRAPRTPTEETIAEVFADVLGLERVGLDDSFFALGGDSIVSIQLVSRAKARGVVFTPREVFEQRTVAGLAEVACAGTGSEPVLRELEGGGVGEIPLTPIVRYMVERGGGFDRYTQTIALELPAGIGRSDVVTTIAAVVGRHDMLRACLRDDGSGEWVLSTSAPGSVDVDALVTRVEVPAEAGDEQWAEIAAREVDAAEGRLAPSQGIVTQFVWLDPAAGAARTGRLIVVAHHLVVDGVSWRILVPDFVTAWAQISHGQQPALQPVGTSFRTWAHALVDGAAGRVTELPLWTSVLDGPDPLLGDRPFDPSVDLASTVVKVPVRVDAATTETLLTTLPELYHGSVNDVLLTGLALALAEWRRARGTDVRSALIRLEGHGREEDVVPGSDLSRTVGWFTTMFPVRLDLSDVDLDDAAAGGASAGAALKVVKEDLRRVPDKGIGYGLLRYCNPETSARLAATPAGQISFNYLGRLDAGEVSTDRVPELGWLPAGDLGDLSGTDDPDAPALAAVDINAVVLGGELGANFGYASGLLDRADVEDLAQRWVRALEALAAHATRPEAGGRTPSDLSLVDVTQRDIDLWESRYRGAADAWPLAPLQAGLLYHALLAEGHSDAYSTQVLVHLAGVVDAQRLRTAADALLGRYPNLRTAFVASESGIPVQVVVDEVTLPWREVDIRGEDSAVLADVLRAEQAVAFDMAEPPLIRFVLVRTGDDSWTLAVTSHHILLDGWSMPLLMKDLLVLYATRGDAGVLGRAPSYRAYLEWLARRDHETSVEAWMRSLDGIEEPTLLAGGNTDGTGGTPDEHRIDLGRERSDLLADTATRLGVTVNTVLQGAWAVLLARTTDRDDVVFGTTVSGRPADLPGVEAMVGLFINTLPVRVRLGAGETGHDLLRRIQGEQAELLDHHHVGLAEIQQRAGTGALFDTLLVYESYPVDRSGIEAAGSIDGLVVAGVNARDATHYPLTAVVTSEEALTLAFKYRSDILAAEDVATLAGRYVRILDALVADPDSSVDSLPYLDAAEIEDLADRWGGPALPAVPLGDLLAETAARNPDGIAVVHEERSLTYAELDARSSRLARLLVAVGIGAEDVIALGLTRSLESIIAVWAVARTGAAYVPVDPNYPADRIAHMISDSAAVLGLTVSSERDRLPRDIPWIDLTAPSTLAELNGLSDEPFAANERIRPVRPSNAAYVIYTSGSTGRPKGVVVTNSGLANFAAEQRDRYGLDTATRALHFASPSFDASVLELLLAASEGGTLVIASPAVYGGRDLADLIRSEGVTHAFITPAAIASLDPEGLDGLRVLVAGGEAVPPALVARWAPGRSFHNGYGPTETTIMTAISDPLVPGEPITIGGPIRGVRALVLDRRLRPVPVGAAGELYLSGVQTARGYHRRAELTAARFVADPYVAGERLYRTGDLVRWTDDGQIVYLGRSDFQVKVRGFRIELDEIDAVLRHEPSVDFAVTVARSHDTGGVRLISYVTATAGHAVDTEDLLRAAARTLPQHMVPADIVVLDAVPLTPVGKLDRAALPEPEIRTRPYRAPRTALEQVVARVYSDALAVEQVGLDGDFFDLGGNSLVATQVVSRLRDETGVEVRVPWLLETPGVEALAARLDEAGQGTGTAPASSGDASAVLVTLRSGDSTEPVFCFHPMIGLAWPYAPLAARLATSSAVYGVQTPALSEPGYTATTLTDLARRYTEEIVAAAPEGRYRLIGWSLGGVLAHAVAVELQARGLHVEDLALIDSIPRVDTDRFAAELSENLRAFGVVIEPDALDGSLPLETAEALVREAPDGLIDLDVERVQRIFSAAVTSPELINGHTPELFFGDMDFFSATEDHPTEADAADLWKPFVSGRIRTRFVPGAHGEMMDLSAIEIIAPALDGVAVEPM
ncbi:non-ribosomal peptide synthetase [Rhodococcus pyridinivorans]|nr:non-ribosomal peptide synthetase [Rhodococcus pyridinivorans]MCD2119456.1 amino acid adenylation domain-containing protein [Rhodococcus pyridinivorans]MCZ4628358.1 non-ribosomal peptide synthetase [Rhodococcus pyridinivorans]MCZ4649594.1 non-ribosomal peptide synthetase [Rhodococcus pyridinivorans]MDJ0483749.1 non-ribosomal peptide synthetase [Rhodococcus pyridinivorans]